MLSDTYKHLGKGDLGQDKDLSDLLRNLSLSRPTTRRLFPAWNLPWVLTYLNSDRFEPLELAPLKELTSKTCFLVALATASRVSELHALSASPENLQFRQDGSVVMITRPGFLAKNRIPSQPQPKIVINAFTGTTRQERMQSPIRALKLYLRRTKDRRCNESRLFLPVATGKQEISAQTVSNWIKQVIKDAYDELSRDASKRLRIRAHEVRAIAASLAFERNVSTSEIISAVGWRSASTFANFYLRDMSREREDLQLVGHVSVPGVGTEALAGERE